MEDMLAYAVINGGRIWTSAKNALKIAIRYAIVAAWRFLQAADFIWFIIYSICFMCHCLILCMFNKMHYVLQLLDQL